MMATEQSISITLGRLTFTIRIAAARTPITRAGTTGVAAARRNVRESDGKRKVVVARHGEHQPDSRGVHRQRAHENREDHLDEQKHAELLSQDVLDEERQAARDPAQLGRGRGR